MGIPELEPPAQERDILCLIHKLTYADGRAYRYLISDANRQLCYMAKRTGLLLPGQTRLVEFFDTQENLVGRLSPPEVAPWLRAEDYQVYIGGEAEEPSAIIHERWRLVDILLLRLPRYEIQLGEHRYVAEGNRYGPGRFYGIFPLEEEELPVEQLEASAFELETELEGAAGPEAEGTEEWSGDAVALEKIIQEEPEAEVESEGEQVGLIECPTAGPSYIIETDVEPLRQTPLLLASLAILIDMEQHA